MPSITNSENIYTLAIESSCDDTSAAVLCNDKVLSNIGNTERNLRLAVLWQEIEEMMRNEIGYYSK